jgi:hypothetical protein
MTFLTFRALAEVPGRRGTRIFGLPREQLIMATISTILLGFPLAFFVAMIPTWEWIGEIAPVRYLNSYVAPPIDALSYDYRAWAMPRFPVKRFLIASISMVQLIFLSNFIALFARRVRRHALRVWACYDRSKVLLYFSISGLAFCGLWYVLFYDWTIAGFLNSVHHGSRYGGGRLFLYLVVAMPFAAAVFGHMAVIVGLGGWRTASRRLRPLCKTL